MKRSNNNADLTIIIDNIPKELGHYTQELNPLFTVIAETPKESPRLLEAIRALKEFHPHLIDNNLTPDPDKYLIDFVSPMLKQNNTEEIINALTPAARKQRYEALESPKENHHDILDGPIDDIVENVKQLKQTKNKHDYYITLGKKVAIGVITGGIGSIIGLAATIRIKDSLPASLQFIIDGIIIGGAAVGTGFGFAKYVHASEKKDKTKDSDDIIHKQHSKPQLSIIIDNNSNVTRNSPTSSDITPRTPLAVEEPIAKPVARTYSEQYVSPKLAREKSLYISSTRHRLSTSLPSPRLSPIDEEQEQNVFSFVSKHINRENNYDYCPSV